MEPAPARLTSVEIVRCLGCGKVYAKPTGRSTLSTNPGCPDCGYLGWLPGGEWVNPAWPRVRSAADPPRRPRQRSR
jgi:predicted  nucleic acid-binding Zn-ribbon protein